MKVHKVTLFIIDTDDIGAESIQEVIQEQRYPNHCIAPKVVSVDTREVDCIDGVDAHPINSRKHWRTALEELFGK